MNVSGCCFSVAFISADEQQEMYLNNYPIYENSLLSKAIQACFAANVLKHNGVNLVNHARITGRRHKHLLSWKLAEERTILPACDETLTPFWLCINSIRSNSVVLRAISRMNIAWSGLLSSGALPSLLSSELQLEMIMLLHSSTNLGPSELKRNLSNCGSVTNALDCHVNVATAKLKSTKEQMWGKPTCQANHGKWLWMFCYWNQQNGHVTWGLHWPIVLLVKFISKFLNSNWLKNGLPVKQGNIGKGHISFRCRWITTKTFLQTKTHHALVSPRLE